MSPFKITALPTVRGVAGLSTTEIKSDLKELLPPSEDNDTDSDSSLMSDDILDSVYPVQPRSAPRSASDAHGFRYQDYSTSGNNVSVDEALFLIKDISKSHNELYAKEKEREEFEQRCQALDTSLEYEKGKFFSTKQEQENYLKLVQGLYARMVRLHSTYSRQNALLHTVYTSLQKQREDEQALTAESAKLKAIGTGAKPVRVTGKAAADSDSAGALLLKVHLRKSNIDVVLQVGQSIPTPMGEGTIAKILPAEQKLVIQLPFGLLYAHLPRAVSWCSTAVVSVDSTNTLVQAHSVHGIQQRYEDTLQDRLTLPAAEVARIHSLVAQQAHSLARRASDEEVANTDNDEASVEDTEEMEDGTVSVTAEAVLASVLSTTDLTEAEQEPTSGNAKASSSSSSSSRRNGNGSGSGEPDHVSVFPMPFDAAAVPARSVVKKKIEAEVNDNFSRYLLQTLPLAFAPAASLPYVAAELGQTSSSTSSGVAHALRLHGVEYDLTALQGLCQNFPTFGAHAGSAHAAAGSEDAPVADRAVASGAQTTLSAGGQLGSSSSLAWQGEIDQLKGSLRELGDQISQLETEQNRKIAEIESLRSKSAQLTAAAATTRLNMFTRRLAHRTNLGNRGIVLPPVAPVMTHQNKSRSSNQSRNHSTAHLNSANGSNSHLAGQDAAMAGAAALLLAAGEGRSSRSKKTSANQRTDEPHGTQDSFASLTTGGPAYMTMRASTDSPISSHSLQGDDAHPTMDARPAANSRSRSRATAFKDDGAETLALLAGNSNKRRNNGRKAADDIIASAGNTQEDEAEAAEGEENENSDAEAPAATGAAPAAAAARKKPKRRRY